MKKKIKAILFDMDGVLIDAKEWHYEAFKKAISLFGYEITDLEHLHNLDGLPTKDKLKLISEKIYLPTELHGFINEIKQIYTNQLIEEKCFPVFCHEYALSKLKQEGYKIAVCSNSIRKTIERMMDKAALTNYLDLILSNEDVKNAKPNPEIYLKAMKMLRVKPDECLILEDNKNGLKAAKDSGGYVLKINDVYEVNYNNIKDKINSIEGDKK